MEIVISTNGTSKDTTIKINGKQVKDLTEFHFSMNPDRKRQGFTIDGKCKMHEMFFMKEQNKGDFRTYYGDEFKKYDEITGEPVNK